MQKRAVIIHGWDGYPDEGWFPWLKQELEAQGYAVQVPAMPNSARPEIGAWVGTLAEIVGQTDNELLLVGHSIGCQTILRYLETLPDATRVANTILVAPFFELVALDTNEEEEIARPWIETPIDYEKIKTRSPQITAIFSDDDPWVPLANVDLFRDRLGAETLVLPQRGHFSVSDGARKVPEILELIERVA